MDFILNRHFLSQKLRVQFKVPPICQNAEICRSGIYKTMFGVVTSIVRPILRYYTSRIRVGVLLFAQKVVEKL